MWIGAQCTRRDVCCLKLYKSKDTLVLALHGRPKQHLADDVIDVCIALHVPVNTLVVPRSPPPMWIGGDCASSDVGQLARHAAVGTRL